jgi:hypothetical protein
MALRWISFSRVSMQRAGSLVAVAAGAGARPTDLAGVTRAYAPLLQRLVPVPGDRAADVARYLRELRLWKRYGEMRDAETVPAGARIEVQDLWLADPRLPSATGAITADVLDEPPQLAATLRLIREQNYTVTDRGKALLVAAGIRTRNDIAADATRTNPLLLGAGARAIMLYALLDADFDFIQSAYRHAAPSDAREFTRADFASRLNDACRDLKARWVRRARTGTERKLLMRLDELAKEIDKPRMSGKKWGGGRPPDQTATVRLEPYVDVGVLTKTDRTAYRYSVSPLQRRFFAALADAEAEDFLDSSLFHAYLEASGTVPVRADEDAIWASIVDAYDQLRSPLAFAAFKEVALLGSARLVEQGNGQYFEVSDAVAILRARRASDPRALRFGVARGGELTYMKLVDRSAAR